MAMMWRGLFILGVLGGAQAYSLNQDFEKNSAVCQNLCGNCGGSGILVEDVCVCSISKPDEEILQCCEISKLRASFHDMGWKIDTKFGSSDKQTSDLKVERYRRALDPRTNFKYKPVSRFPLLRRSLRSPQPLRDSFSDMGYYDLPNVERQGSRPLGQEGTAKYEIVIGNNGEHSVQLMFPHSNGIEVEHQYLYEGSDGVEYPCRGPVREYDTHKESGDHWIRNINPNHEDSWEQDNYRRKEDSLERYNYHNKEDNYRSDENVFQNVNRWSSEMGDIDWDSRERGYNSREEGGNDFSAETGDGYDVITESRETHRSSLSEELGKENYKYEERIMDYGTGSMADMTSPWDKYSDLTTTGYEAPSFK